MRMTGNPFEYGREPGLLELVDRVDERHQISAPIRNRAKLFVIGPRRFGKTSLPAEAGEEAKRKLASVDASPFVR